MERPQEREETARHSRIKRQGGRQLDQHRSTFRLQAAAFVEKLFERRAAPTQLLFVSNLFGQLHRKAELGWS